MEASSSDQMIGRWNERAQMPTKRMSTSAATSRAAGISTMRRSQRSASATHAGAAASQAVSWEWDTVLMPVARHGLERLPGVGAELVLPGLVEAVVAQLLAEGGLVGGLEREPRAWSCSFSTPFRRTTSARCSIAARSNSRVTISCRSAGKREKARRFAISQKGSQMWLVSETYFCTS